MSTPWWTVTVAGGVDELELAQVGAERGGRRAGRRVLDDAADRERVARVEGGLVLAVDEVDGDQVVGEHQLLERLEVVVEVGEALAGVAPRGSGGARRRRRRAAGARGRAPRGSSRARSSASSSSSCGASSTCGRDARQRRGDRAVGALVSTGTAPACVWKHERAGAVALGQRDAGGDRRVPAERHLGLGAEVADVVARRPSRVRRRTRSRE